MGLRPAGPPGFGTPTGRRRGAGIPGTGVGSVWSLVRGGGIGVECVWLHRGVRGPQRGIGLSASQIL
jgi:hypothetical protein